MQVMERCYNFYLSVSLQAVIFPACVLVLVLRVAAAGKEEREEYRGSGNEGRAGLWYVGDTGGIQAGTGRRVRICRQLWSGESEGKGREEGACEGTEEV